MAKDSDDTQRGDAAKGSQQRKPERLSRFGDKLLPLDDTDLTALDDGLEPEVVYVDDQGRVLQFVNPRQPQRPFPLNDLRAQSIQLARLQTAEDLLSLDVDGLHALSVFPGDRIATCSSSISPPPRTAQLVCSEGIEQRQNGDIHAERYGYIVLQGDRLSLLSPLWITPDHIHVYWLLLDPWGVKVQHDWLDGWWDNLQLKGRPDFDVSGKSAVDDVWPRAILLAQGKPALHGEDAEIEFFVKLEQDVGRLQADGSIDFYEVNFVANAMTDQPIARRKRATKGVPGEDVFGNVIPARDGKAQLLRSGEHIRLESQGGDEVFHATRDGAVRYRNDILSVTPVLSLNKGVNFETGNIAFNGEVFISGEIMSGFSVDAAGDIFVLGAVDNNTRITSKGSVTISQGVSGPKTVITAGEKIQTRFVQGAKLVAEGQIMLGSFAYHSTIRSGDTVTVARSTDDRGGSILSGVTRARRGVDAVIAGTPTWEKTELCVGLSYEQAEALEQVEDDIEKRSRHIRQLLDFFGLARIEPEKIHRMIGKANNETQKKGLTLRAKQLGLQAKNYQSLLHERDLFLSKIGPVDPNAHIRIRDRIYPGVTIRLGRHSKTMDDGKEGGVRLKLAEKRIVELMD